MWQRKSFTQLCIYIRQDNSSQQCGDHRLQGRSKTLSISCIIAQMKISQPASPLTVVGSVYDGKLKSERITAVPHSQHKPQELSEVLHCLKEQLTLKIKPSMFKEM